MGRYFFGGNFNTMGTGYQTIIAELGVELTNQGHEVWVLGHKWNKGPHGYPFTVIPSDINWIPAQGAHLSQLLSFEAGILAMDIPRIGHMVKYGEKLRDWKCPKVGLFPVESTPILPVWAAALKHMDGLCTISQFGKRALLSEHGLDATWLPMTARIPEDPPTKEGAIEAIKALIPHGSPEALDGADIIIGTIADNQERKNLPAIIEAVRILNSDGLKVAWILLTSVGSAYGWHFPHVIRGIRDHVVVVNWGVTQDIREHIYSASDYIVLASEAEGACLPIYEAMARGKTVIAPDNTAITEALFPDRGILVPPGFKYTHPFGNVDRYKVDPLELAQKIKRATQRDPEELREFIRRRPWQLAAQMLLGEIKNAKEAQQKAKTQGDQEPDQGPETAKDWGPADGDV